ncbi:MAG TPA: carboxypeptidase-like regulatory domain-containing protein [Pirellulales bacterium]|nr:carboxypeptidase-like regulatory domain-containing protein [Pirellulales bacterium]
MLSHWGGGMKKTMLSIACCGMILPVNVWAAEGQSTPGVEIATVAPPAATPMVSDVALQAGNVLQGQVVDSAGQPVSGAPVSLLQQQQEIAKATTAADGSFQVNGVRGGVYRVVTFQGDGTYRAWPMNAAPPAAKPKIVLTQNSSDAHPVIKALTSPLAICAIVATAIAVPVALANRNHGSSS